MKLAKEAWPLVAVLAAGTLLVALSLHPLAALVPLALLLFTVGFFRDPDRRTPSDPRALISPADGRVIRAGPKEISIFMNVFNVHVCRTPIAGRVEQVRRYPGRFISAFKDSAAEHNERTEVEVAGAEARLRFRLVAGLVARRIVCRVAPGDRLEAGQRIGLIQFGSRVDVALPSGAEVRVRLGQRVVAGETIIAQLPPGAGA